MTSPLLTQINIFPIKSCRGISLQHSALESRGLAHDRRWMLIDTQHRFVTQRQMARMSLISTRLSNEAIEVSYPGLPALSLPKALEQGKETTARVWEDDCPALEADTGFSQWFSQALGQDLTLVYMPDSSERRIDPEYARDTDITSFSDGFPLLLISEASLQDLNGRLEQPLAMTRFRPNLVVKGCAPYAEDKWKRIRIGGIEFEIVKPCSRCIITTIDPETGVRSTDREPLRTLSQYRKQGNKVFFGQNLIHRDRGRLETGSPIEILDQD